MAMADEIDLRDEDRLPWLETVEADEQEGPTVARTIALVVLGLVVLAAIVLGVYRLQRPSAPAGNGDLIVAQEGDYKMRPDDPGGMKVNGEGDAAIATSAGKGADGGRIDLNAVPEKPVTATKSGSGQGNAPATAAGDKAVSSVPQSGGKLTAAPPMSAPRTNVPGAATGGSLVQLGAFPSEAAANGAWSAMAKRFAYIATLGKSVQTAEVGGRKVYRLRVNAGSAGAASDVCGRLKVAGETCFVVAN
jgi:hypothetical protein